MHRYEAYLDSYITPADLYFLTEAGMARQLVELGYGLRLSPSNLRHPH